MKQTLATAAVCPPAWCPRSRRVAHPFVSNRLLSLRFGCPILVAFVWRQGGPGRMQPLIAGEYDETPGPILSPRGEGWGTRSC